MNTTSRLLYWQKATTLIVVLPALLGTAYVANADDSRPNILFIIVDD